MLWDLLPKLEQRLKSDNLCRYQKFDIFLMKFPIIFNQKIIGNRLTDVTRPDSHQDETRARILTS